MTGSESSPGLPSSHAPLALAPPPQILSKATFAPRDEPQRRVWSGWLTCVNGNPEYLRSLPKDFICLPLFGSHGPENLTTVVKSWFQGTFDCCFGPLEISQTSLQWLMALWTNCHAESSIQHLTMVWSIPVAPPLQVTYTVDPQDAWELWSSVRKERDGGRKEEEEDQGSVDIEEVTHFIQSLKSHFYRHFRLDVSAGCLSQVSTGLGSAKASGRIKVRARGKVFGFLTHRDDFQFQRTLHFVPDLQQQIHDHDLDAPDRVRPPQVTHLSDMVQDP